MIFALNRKARAALIEKGLLAYVWIYDPETGESTRKIAITDRGRDLINGLARKD